MRRISIYKNYAFLYLFVICQIGGIRAQDFPRESPRNVPEHPDKPVRKAWEIGVGIAGLRLTRLAIAGSENARGGYDIAVSKKDFLPGGHIYLAHELTPHFYLDLQGTLGYADDPVHDRSVPRWVTMAGLGLQWRLGEYFRSSYVDPFLRIGANHMYKTFLTDYSGTEHVSGKEIDWHFSNDYNKEGADRHHLIPVSFGGGVNMWLNDRFGLNLQADYLLMPYRHVADSWQATFGLVWRIGGKSKKSEPEVRYVERIVEKIVEKPVVVEKTVTLPAEKEILHEFFESIYFDFDRATITGESMHVLDKIARLMKKDTSRRFLITGCTDAQGSSAYNQVLSERRAAAVVSALVERGVPAAMLKSRGAGRRIANVPAATPDRVRRGDRKIIVEIVTNREYWDRMPE